MAEPCSFCRRPRSEVWRLLVCEDAAICGDCLGEALAALVHSTGKQHSAPARSRGPAKANGHALGKGGAGGFTGDMCDSCQQFMMVRTGTCLTCMACGSTSGGCS